MFLTPDELRDLTEARAFKRQIAWLRTHGYRFELSSRGRPKVLRSVVERRLGHAVPTPQKQPNFDALNGYGTQAKS